MRVMSLLFKFSDSLSPPVPLFPINFPCLDDSKTLDCIFIEIAGTYSPSSFEAYPTIKIT